MRKLTRAAEKPVHKTCRIAEGSLCNRGPHFTEQMPTGALALPPHLLQLGQALGVLPARWVSQEWPASLFHTSRKRLHSTNGLLGSFELLTLRFTKGSLLQADANWLKSGGPCGSQGPDPGERHAFDPWSQKEEQKEPNLLSSSFWIYISQTAWDHGFCLFIGGRRDLERTILN